MELVKQKITFPRAELSVETEYNTRTHEFPVMKRGFSTIGELFDAAKWDSDEIFLVKDSQRLTFRQVFERVCSVSRNNPHY